MHTAVGTSLVLLIPNALLSTRHQFKMGNFDFKLLKEWIPFVVLGAFIGVSIIKFISTTYLKVIFTIYLFSSFFICGVEKNKEDELEGRPHGIGMRVGGILIGEFSVLLGMGECTFSVPFFQLYNYPIKKSIAFASATGIFIGIVGTIGVIISVLWVSGRAPYSLWFINLLTFVYIFPTIVIFPPFCVRTANHLSIKQVRKMYAGFLLFMGLYMVSHIFIPY